MMTVPRRLFVVESEVPGSGSWGGSYREAVALLAERAQENRATWWYVRAYDVGDFAGALVAALNGVFRHVGGRATLGERVARSWGPGCALAAVRPGEAIEVAEAPCASCGEAASIEVTENLVMRADLCCPHCTWYDFRYAGGAYRVIVEGVILEPRWDLLPSGAGFAWGHEDAAAEQTALAVLVTATASDRVALRWYEDFKREVIAGVEAEIDWRLSGAAIAEWLGRKIRGNDGGMMFDAEGLVGSTMVVLEPGGMVEVVVYRCTPRQVVVLEGGRERKFWRGSFRGVEEPGATLVTPEVANRAMKDTLEAVEGTSILMTRREARRAIKNDQVEKVAGDGGR